MSLTAAEIRAVLAVDEATASCAASTLRMLAGATRSTSIRAVAVHLGADDLTALMAVRALVAAGVCEVDGAGRVSAALPVVEPPKKVRAPRAGSSKSALDVAKCYSCSRVVLRGRYSALDYDLDPQPLSEEGQIDALAHGHKLAGVWSAERWKMLGIYPVADDAQAHRTHICERPPPILVAPPGLPNHEELPEEPPY